jgi:hypothetical protein
VTRRYELQMNGKRVIGLGKSVAGWPHDIDALRAITGIDRRRDLGGPQWDRLRALVEEAERELLGRKDAISWFSDVVVERRFPTSTSLVGPRLLEVASAIGPLAMVSEAVNELAMSRGLSELPERATVAELKELIDLLEQAASVEEAGPWADLVAKEELSEPLARLVEAAVAGEASSLAAAEAVYELVVRGSDLDADEAAEKAEEALSKTPVWADSGFRPRQLTVAVLQGRVVVREAADADGVDGGDGESPVSGSSGVEAVISSAAITHEVKETGPDTGSSEPATDSSEPATGSSDAPVETESCDDPPVAAQSVGEGGAKTVAGTVQAGEVRTNVESLEPLESPPPASSDDGNEEIADEPKEPCESTAGPPALSATAVQCAAIAERRWGLAYWAACVADEHARAHAYAAVTLAEHQQSSTGLIAGAIEAEFAGLGADAFDVPGVAPLALAAGLRSAVFGSTPELLRLLDNLAVVFEYDESVREAIRTVLMSLRSGVVIAAASSSLRDMADVQAATQGASEAARTGLTDAQTKTNKYTAATVVWRVFVDPATGLLGQLLSNAADDNRSQLESTAERVRELRVRGRLRDEIQRADRRVKKHQEIQAGALERLLDWSDDALELVEAWVEAVRREQATDDGAHQNGLLNRLSEAMQAFDPTKVAVGEDSDPVARIAVDAAVQSLTVTRRLYIEGTEPPTAEPATSHLLTDDLLLNPHPRLADGRPDVPPTLEGLATAVGRDPRDLETWQRAYALRAEVGDHQATDRIVDLARSIDSAAGDALDLRRSADLDGVRTALDRELTAVRDRLAAARSSGQLDESEWSHLAGLIESVNPAVRVDLGRLKDQLAYVDRSLEERREELAADLRIRLQEHSATLVRSIVGRIEERVDAGDFATAEEYLALALDGRDLPEPLVDAGVFEEWWPSRAVELETVVLDSRTEHAARRGDNTMELDFSRIDEPSRELVADALNAWRTLAAGRPSGELHEVVRPILSLLGIEARNIEGVPQLRKDGSREWRLISGFRRIGRALVPDFGSQSSGAAVGDTLLLLIVWSRQKPGTVASWIADDRSNRPLMVWYAQPLDAADRLQLADELRPASKRRPVVVIDAGLVAHLATLDDRDFETVMRLALPFAAVNPYQAVGGLTPVEMFYGRDLERASLRDMTGSALVYGGRQLGKSSLLRAAERDFDNGISQRALYLDLKAHQIGVSKPPNAIFDLLWSELTRVGVIKGEPPHTQIEARLRDGVTRWLDDRPGRALLVLLDECDFFLETDARELFATVTSLKGWMDATGRRVKFVFAGLHKVQRFKSVENQPLAHLGAPIAVGPLRPQDAMSLVSSPMHALGYRWEHPTLPSRILAFCNNNPSLIVLFMQALINRLLERRLAGVHRQPPVVVTSDDIEATFANPTVSERIRERFELTLDLDPAYKVIAYVVAQHAHDVVDSPELTARELREKATYWWGKGFSEISADGFRALCDELVDLGVLAYRGGAYGLRSPNILRFLGSRDEMEDVLLEAENREPSEIFDATAARPRFGGDREVRSPLTAAQLVDLCAPRNQARLVLGSRLSGIERVAQALTEHAGARITIDTPSVSTNLAQYRNSSGQHRLLIIDLDAADGTRAKALIQSAIHRPGTGGSLGVVFTASSKHLDLWNEVSRGGETWDRLGAVTLGPLDEAAWRYWLIDAELKADSATAELLARSGGWPDLLEPAVAARRDGRKNALDALDEQLNDRRRLLELLEFAGVSGDLREAFKAICQLVDSKDHHLEIRAAAAEGVGSGKADEIVDLLTMLGALHEGSGGDLVLNTALAHAARIVHE